MRLIYAAPSFEEFVAYAEAGAIRERPTVSREPDFRRLIRCAEKLGGGSN